MIWIFCLRIKICEKYHKLQLFCFTKNQIELWKKSSNMLPFVLNFRIYLHFYLQQPRIIPPRNERKDTVISFSLLIVRNKLYLIFKLFFFKPQYLFGFLFSLSHMQSPTAYFLIYAMKLYAVSKWPAAGQGLQITKWPAVELLSNNSRNLWVFNNLSTECPIFIS